MSLLLLGISHHTAPIEEREGLALADGALPGALELLAAQPGVREGMIVSTCNRVEVVVDAAPEAGPDLIGFLAAATGVNQPPAPARFYQLAHEAAARHVFRVASSLDSLVVGEPQILGQLKQAYAAAQAAGTVGFEIEALMTRAFHAAKRVRNETAIAAQPVSVSQAAVDLARQIFGDMGQRTVLLVGAGAAGESAARYLVRQGACRLLVANRTWAGAQALAAKFGGEALPWETLRDHGERADVVITCTGAPHPLITRGDATHFLARRHGRPMLFLDLAVPRDVEPSVHQLENAYVYNVDDLDQVVSSNLAERRQEAALGEKIIEDEVGLYLQRRQSRDLAPTLRALQAQAESLRLAEWERVRRRLGPLSAEQEQAVEALTRSLMQKWLHRPMTEIKEASGGSAPAAERRALLTLIHRLFALPQPPEKE
ncbi:MAG: glutamyl-tRNA reductase [Terriglobales bacterium]